MQASIVLGFVCKLCWCCVSFELSYRYYLSATSGEGGGSPPAYLVGREPRHRPLLLVPYRTASTRAPPPPSRLSGALTHVVLNDRGNGTKPLTYPIFPQSLPGTYQYADWDILRIQIKYWSSGFRVVVSTPPPLPCTSLFVGRCHPYAAKPARPPH